MKKLVAVAKSALMLACMIVAFLVPALFFGSLGMASAIFTVAIIATGTVVSFRGGRIYAVMSLCGILLYAVSWWIAKSFGPTPAAVVCGAAILVWFFAFMKAVVVILSRTKTIART